MTAMQVDLNEQSDTLLENLCIERRQTEARLVMLEAARPITIAALPTTSGADSPTDRDPVASGEASTTSASGNLARKDSAHGKGTKKPEWNGP
ncbi:hypothetical protein N7G274_009038 [Stereocaulon virgatum]|uniref:Uncharacterized protein n=1 Tax=Stereocaulon virgatum TaxID=373712 RepID=A0ABR3ZZG8_9LECA